MMTSISFYLGNRRRCRIFSKNVYPPWPETVPAPLIVRITLSTNTLQAPPTWPIMHRLLATLETKNPVNALQLPAESNISLHRGTCHCHGQGGRHRAMAAAGASFRPALTTPPHEGGCVSLAFYFRHHSWWRQRSPSRRWARW